MIHQQQLINHSQHIHHSTKEKTDPSNQETDIELQECDSQHQVEQQSGESTLTNTNKRNILSNHKGYPNNCLFYVKTYLKPKSHQNQQNKEQLKQSKEPYFLGFGTLVSQNLIVSCAHLIINKNMQEYEQNPQRIQIFSGNQKRTIDDYRFIPQYLSQDTEISRLNDAAVLYFKEPIKRSKYIEIGIISSFDSDKILIPKVSENKLEFTYEQKPVIDPTKQRIVTYKIKTQKGDSGSPIILPKCSDLDIFYLVGMHKAGLFKKINNKRVNSKGEGILFNKEVIQFIMDFETELIQHQHKRVINKQTIEIDKRQKYYKQFLRKVLGPMFSLNGQDEQKACQIYERMSKNYPKIMGSFPNTPQLEMKDQFNQLLVRMRQIKQEQQNNKLRQLIRFISSTIQNKTTLTESQLIIKEIYLHLKQLESCERSEQENRRISRKIHQILDQLTCSDLIKDCQLNINEYTQLSKYDGMLYGGYLALFALKKLMIKSYLYFLAVSERESKWFGIQCKHIPNQQAEIYSLDCFDKNQNNSSQQLLNQINLGHLARYQSITQKSASITQSYILNKEQRQLYPYQLAAVKRNTVQNVNILIVYLNEGQDSTTVQQIGKTLKYYHGAQSNAMHYLQLHQKCLPTNYQKLQQGDAFQPFIKQILSYYDLDQICYTLNNLLSVNSKIKFYYCQQVQLINSSNLIQSIDSNYRLHFLLLSIADQYMELHQEQYSLCCPLEYCMNINIKTLQVTFFYVGHPKSLVQFILREYNQHTQEKLIEYYPIEQILDLSTGSPKEFRRVDVWMLGKSLLRLLKSIHYDWILQSIYYNKLWQLIERQMLASIFDRIKIVSFKKQLIRLGEQYL